MEDRGVTGRAIGIAVLVAAVLGATWCAATVIDRSSEEVYGIPGWGVALTVGFLVLAVTGGGLVIWTRQTAFAGLVVAGSALAALGLLGMASFGILLLPVAVALLAWGGSERWAGRRSALAVAGSVLVGVSLPPLVLLASDGPLVECHEDGSSGGENFFMGVMSGSGESTGSITSEVDGSGAGRESSDAYEYTWQCRDGKLVDFDLRWR